MAIAETLVGKELRHRRGTRLPRQPFASIGCDGRWLLHLDNKLNMRTEMMIVKSFVEPYCSVVSTPYTD